MATASPQTPAPRFQANLNFNAIMSKMEQNVKSIGSALKHPKKPSKPLRTTSTTKMRTYFGDEELLNTVPEAFYHEGFDPVTDILSKMPTDFDDAYLDKLIEGKEAILEVVNGRLFTKVMGSYGAFVQGMTQIGELSGDLQQSTIMCKNGRRNLHVVKEQLTLGGLVILSKFRRRQNLALIVQDLLQIRSLLVFQQVLQKLLHIGDYPRTIATCLEARKTVARCSKYTVIRELDLGLQGVYNNVAERLDKALFDICRNFTPDNYEGLIAAYKLLGSTSRIAERLQSNFVDPIEADTKSIVLAHVLLSPENMHIVEQIKKKPFKDACADVKGEHFMNCLLAILEFMCDLMFSHFAMSKWHSERQSGEENRGYAEIGAAMDRFKKTMWDAMQRQATLMITSTNLTAFKVEEFTKVVDAVSQFLDIGEEFSSTIAVNCRNLLKSQAKQYLETFHKQRVEDLKTMVDNEQWTHCPVPPNFSVEDVKEFMECLSPSVPTSSSTLSSSTSSTSITTVSSPSSLSSSLSKIPKSMFGTIVSNGNPFSKMIQYQKRTAPPSHSVSSSSSSQANRSRAKSALPVASKTISTLHANRIRANSASASALDSDSDEEPAELRADFIDEDSEGAAVVRKRVEPVQPNKGPLLSPSTISVVRLFAKYVHLLRVLHQSSLGLEVFVAAVQLVDYFIYTIFSLFGSPPPGSGLSQDELLLAMTSPLRKMITRLKERLAPPPAPVFSSVSLPESAASKASAANISNSPHDLVKIKWTLVKLTPVQSSEMTSAKNGFGIAMRTVAVESLAFLAEALIKAKPVLQSLMPVNASEFFSTFYTHVGLIPELKLHMYKAATSGLLVTESIGKSVENNKWDTSLVKVETSDYVDKLLKELVQFGQRLDKAGALPPKVKASVWEAAIIRGIEVVVDAYSKIKKCTSEGRANMMQDINALQRGIEKIAPLRGQSQVPGISHALNYVNAYYLPLDDIPDWARSHTEFPIRQILALVALNPESSSNRSKKQLVVAALDEIDKARRK